jgi:glyoxylase-like metal-dependent hydrolase (beta-lactamase superfamily II)
MNATPIGENIIQLTRVHFVNAFLVREDDGFTLVDTTLGGGADALIDAARSAGAEIRRIALTHGHGDHIGSLDGLKEKLGNSVEVFMPDLDARILAGEKVVDGKLPGSWPKGVKAVPDVRLTGGERIGSLEVVPSPGHSPGHVSFLDTRGRALLAGDVYTSYGRVETTTKFYWRLPFAYFPTWDKPIDLESARALRALNPAMLLVGHGPASSDPAEAMEQAIARAER